MAAATDKLANAASGVGGGVLKAGGYAIKKVPTVIGIGGAFLLVAAMVTSAPAVAGGVAVKGIAAFSPAATAAATTTAATTTAATTTAATSTAAATTVAAGAPGGITLSQLPAGILEGFVEGTQKVGEFGTWMAGKAGSLAATVPGAGVPIPGTPVP